MGNGAVALAWEDPIRPVENTGNKRAIGSSRFSILSTVEPHLPISAGSCFVTTILTSHLL